jgi:hypothetical protein
MIKRCLNCKELFEVIRSEDNCVKCRDKIRKEKEEKEKAHYCISCGKSIGPPYTFRSICYCSEHCRELGRKLVCEVCKKDIYKKTCFNTVSYKSMFPEDILEIKRTCSEECKNKLLEILKPIKYGMQCQAFLEKERIIKRFADMWGEVKLKLKEDNDIRPEMKKALLNGEMTIELTGSKYISNRNINDRIVIRPSKFYSYQYEYNFEATVEDIYEDILSDSKKRTLSIDAMEKANKDRSSASHALTETIIKYKRPDWMSEENEIRSAIFERDNYICLECGRHPPEVKLQLGHIIPRVFGGTYGIYHDEDLKYYSNNLYTTCEPCNTGRGIKIIRPEQSGAIYNQLLKPIKLAQKVYQHYITNKKGEQKEANEGHKRF